ALDTFCCGIGPVEAALQTARALAERKPDAVIHVGIAGSRTLEPPALVLGSEAVYCDVIDHGSTLPRVERARPDAALLERAQAVLPEAHVLPIWTGVPGWPTRIPPGSTSTRSHGSPRSIVSVPRSGTKTSSWSGSRWRRPRVWAG